MCRNVTGTAAGWELTTDFKQCFTFKCKASCCFKCSYCARAFPKERNKSRVSRLSLHKLYIKVCEKCFLCHSIVLCSTCNKCQKCCPKSACRGQTSKLLANLAGSGCQSENSSNPEGGLHPSFSDPAKSHKVSHSHKLLCQSPQEQLPDGGITSAYRQKCCRTTGCFWYPKPNNKWRPILDLSNQNPFLKVEKFKMETLETIRTSLHQGEWVTSIDLKDTYFHIPIQEQSIKYLRFFTQGRTYQFKALPFSLSTAPLEFTVVVKEVKLMAMHKGIRIHQYLDNWLVRARSHPPVLSPAYSEPSKNVPRPRLAGECREVGAGAQASLQFCRLTVRPQVRSGPTDTGQVAKPSRENERTFVTTDLPGPAVYVLDRFVNSHRETSSPRPTAYEAHTVAFQKQLESARISKQDDSNTQVSAPSLTMVAGGNQCAPRSTIAPLTTCSANFHRRVKRRVGHIARGSLISGYPLRSL